MESVLLTEGHFYDSTTYGKIKVISLGQRAVTFTFTNPKGYEEEQTLSISHLASSILGQKANPRNTRPTVLYVSAKHKIVCSTNKDFDTNKCLKNIYPDPMAQRRGLNDYLRNGYVKVTAELFGRMLRR